MFGWFKSRNRQRANIVGGNLTIEQTSTLFRKGEIAYSVQVGAKVKINGKKYDTSKPGFFEIDDGSILEVR